MLTPLMRSPTRGKTPPPTARRIVALGGGTGLPTVLRSLRLLLKEGASPETITAIVAVSDDGGSSGRLRKQFNMLAPGDVRNCVAALADDSSPLAEVLQYRWPDQDGVAGHAVGNLLLAALTRQMHGDFAAAVTALSRMVGTGGRVLPATAQQVRLRAEFESGDIVTGETAIAARRQPIRRLSLDTHVRPLPEAIQALVNADVIIVGPGSLYTSILPVLLTDGIAPTIYGLKATRIYVANLMTEPGETDGFTLERHVQVIEQHVGLPLFDYVLANRAPVTREALSRYAAVSSAPVMRDPRHGAQPGAPCIVERSLSWQVAGNKVRHEPAHLAAALSELIESDVQGRATA